MQTDGIILLTKKTGPTSFKSLHSVKKALNTSKVGHTGTLDSFAQGLLVVCIGRLTRLSGNITQFNKTYKAVIKFGEETDTLEYTGKIIKTTPLPALADFQNAVQKFTGDIMQSPPSFSAIHIDGKRASDIAKSGNEINIPPRKVTVFNSQIEEIKYSQADKNKVEYALVEFSVSKGTYIRSLARDIAYECGSAAHLVGLYRTQVGSFSIKDAVGFESLTPFTIENAIHTRDEYFSKHYQQNQKDSKTCTKTPHQKFVVTQEELELQENIRTHLSPVTKDIATQCGFININLATDNALSEFQNGKSLRSKNFTTNLHDLPINSTIAVFSKYDFFTGLIEKDVNGRISYKFVIN